MYESTAAHTLFLCPDVNPRVSIKLCRNKHTSYTQSLIFGHFPRGKNRSFFRALGTVDFALGRRGDFEAGKNRRGLFPAEVLASVFGDSALSALFRRNSRGEVFAAVFKFLLGWAEFYRDSDRLIGLPGGLPVRTPFPRETYGYLFPFPLKGAGMRSRDIADGKFAFC